MSNVEYQKVLANQVYQNLEKRVLKHLTPAEKSQYKYLQETWTLLSEIREERRESTIRGAGEIPVGILEIGKIVLDLIRILRGGPGNRVQDKLRTLNQCIHPCHQAPLKIFLFELNVFLQHQYCCRHWRDRVLV